ncbi:hypothetical protein L1987_77278 [Smallanthus sonchifolius]|uniref:Uncharacterized protein n=1 Tax=Smallanthus sonchifolius TaxID=185202 RepID=A0ACB8ZAK5_9ASTR|nr:hypothetical protein L1987_77278 [Smallanthus sonchifolius]
MLGHDASFGYIHAKDLISDNFVVVCAALNVACKLIDEETIPAVIQQVVELLGHQKEAARKKAVKISGSATACNGAASVLPKVSLICNTSCIEFSKGICRLYKLCDSDPGVMGATLCPLFDLIMIDVHSYKDLVGSFVKNDVIMELLRREKNAEIRPDEDTIYIYKD